MELRSERLPDWLHQFILSPNGVLPWLRATALAWRLSSAAGTSAVSIPGSGSDTFGSPRHNAICIWRIIRSVGTSGSHRDERRRGR